MVKNLLKITQYYNLASFPGSRTQVFTHYSLLTLQMSVCFFKVIVLGNFVLGDFFFQQCLEIFTLDQEKISRYLQEILSEVTYKHQRQGRFQKGR